MAIIRPVTDLFSAAPQIDPADLPQLAADGYAAVICNRPDEEDPGQPDAATIAAAAAAAGLAFTHIAVAGAIAREQVDAMARALAAAGSGRVLAYCRSGTRSTNLWALARASAGAEPDGLIAAAARGGYDLSGLRPMLARLSGR